MHNLYSGEVLYNKKITEALRLENEGSGLAFVGEKSPFWIIAPGWDGQMSFFNKPTKQLGREFVNQKKFKSSHRGDVTTLDING